MLAVEWVAPSDVSGWDIAIAGIVLVASLFIARAARKAVTRGATHVEGVSEGIRKGAARATFYLVLLAGVGVALGALGADVQAVQTVVIVGAVVAVLALRGVAPHFAAGVVLQSTHPYRAGDQVELLDHVGIVKELGSYSTVIQTFDGSTVHIPNAEVASNAIVNRSTGGSLRVDIEVRARAAAGKTEEVLDLLGELTRSCASVLAQPPPIVSAKAAEPDRLVALIRAWHDASLDGTTVAGGIVVHLHSGLRGRGIDAAVVSPPPPPPFTPSATV